MQSFIIYGKNIHEGQIYNYGQCNFVGRTITSLFNHNKIIHLSHFLVNSKQSKVQVKHTYKVVLCEAYKVGWDFVIVRSLRSRMGLCYCPGTTTTITTTSPKSCSFAHWRRPFLLHMQMIFQMKSFEFILVFALNVN